MTPLGLARLLWSLIGCQHTHAIKERRGGVLFLVCECGHVAEAIRRTTAERRQIRKQFPALTPSKAQRVPRPNVEPLRKVR